jgi:precorrin-6Y C5,15-methyltransferase (decarboxylating)
LWDLGAGSGSVAIEASMFLKTGKIIAIEQKTDRVENIRANCRQFKIRNLEVFQADLPNGLEQLPKPDRIFIGGGGKELGKIIDAAAYHLKPGGIIVVNTVLIQSLDIALESLKKNGFETDFVQIQISRSQKMPWGERLYAQNPVWIISGERNSL